MHSKEMRWMLLALVAVLLLGGSCAQGRFDETLTVIPLAHNGRVAMIFNFSIDWDSDSSNGHYELCPKTLCSLVSDQKIYQLDLTMTKGRWNYEKWGNSPLPAPQGAEMTVFFDDTLSPQQADEYWQATTNKMAGQFCASLEYMYKAPVDTERVLSTHPITPFRMSAQTSAEERNIRLMRTGQELPYIPMRHAILHGETVCTENLTPWMKLLPCRSESGLAKYLSNPSFMLNFDYVSLGVHVLPAQPKKQLQLTLMLVVDRNLPPVPASITKFAPPPKSPIFDLQALLGVSLTQKQHVCPLASSSRLIVHRPTSNGPSKIQSPCETEICDLLSKPEPWNVVMSWNDEKRIDTPDDFKGFVTAHRWTNGWGHQGGKLAIEISNHLPHNVTVQYRQVTPFMLRLMFHTMKAIGTKIDGAGGEKEENFEIEPTFFNVEPGLDRLTMTSLEMGFALKARTKVLVTIDYDLVFLHWTEHPPDAHRGFDIAAGVTLVTVDHRSVLEMNKAYEFGALAPVCTEMLDERKGRPTVSKFHFLVYTEGIVLSLPTPDFSMPYNVITLTSTVLAIIFAFTVKTLTRRYGLLFKDGSFSSDRAIVVIIKQIISFFQRRPQQNINSASDPAVATGEGQKGEKLKQD